MPADSRVRARHLYSHCRPRSDQFAYRAWFGSEAVRNAKCRCYVLSTTVCHSPEWQVLQSAWRGKMRRADRIFVCALASIFVLAVAALFLPEGLSRSESFAAQSAPASASQTPTNEALRAQLTSLRDSFVAEVKAAGFKPSIEPPQIVIDTPPAFGRYDSGSNLLHIASWNTLEPAGEARFTRLKTILNDPRSPEEIFEDSIHRWVFVHELSHWVQACQHKDDGERYAVEYGANRIAAAYWRLKDPAYMQSRTEHFRAIYNLIPNPLPGGESKETYFNANFATIAGTPAYSWFQAGMVVDVSAENPLPTFKQALQ